MSTKSFTEAKKPGRQPTAEEIAAFEKTGRAMARQRKITAKAERRERRNTEKREAENTGSRERGNPELQKGDSVVSQECGNTENNISADTETQIAEAMVRLTIDLPEGVHTRFKAACARNRRKMVEEVRGFIERRTSELERG